MGEQPKRFSKFDPCLPEDLLAQLVVESSLDVPSARKVLTAAFVETIVVAPPNEYRASPGVAPNQHAPEPASASAEQAQDAIGHQALKIKCLSIRPAWAWMIIYLQTPRWKDVENRSWTTKYRGPLLIHASQGLTREEYDEACSLALSRGGARPDQLPKFADVQRIRGQLIGAVTLVNVAPPGKEVSPWHGVENYGWQLANRVPFTPRPLTGKLSLFEVEPTAEELTALRTAGSVPPPR